MNKAEIQTELQSVKQKINSLESSKQNEIKEQIKIRVLPLREKANKIESEIKDDITRKHEVELSELNKKKIELNNKLSEIAIQESKSIWYPEGTIVYLWEFPKYGYSFSTKNLKKTDKTGVVVVYDGTQKISSLKIIHTPQKGDIIVIHRKKDGSIGVKYDIISCDGRLKRHAARWYSENETPENNLAKRIFEEEDKNEKEYEY